MNKFHEILKSNEPIDYYETFDFAIYLYGLIRMIRPRLFIELGTGYGSTALLTAQAFEEIGSGRTVTIDDGSQWTEKTDYQSYVRGRIAEFELESTCDFICGNDFEILKSQSAPEILFNDIRTEPEYNVKLLVWLISKLESECYFFIDRGATVPPCVWMLEAVIPELNRNRVPPAILKYIEDPDAFAQRVSELRFDLQYVRKAARSDQDSFVCIHLSKRRRFFEEESTD